MSARQLLGDSLAAYAHLLRRQPRLVHGRARLLDPLLERRALRLALAQQRFEFIAGDFCSVELLLDLCTYLQRLFERRELRHERGFPILELSRQFVAALGQFLQLLLQTLERGLQRGVRRAA
jgi:hypothetical protein